MARAVYNHECLGRHVDVHTFKGAEMPDDATIEGIMRGVLSDDALWHDSKFVLHVMPDSWTMISYNEHITNGRF